MHIYIEKIVLHVKQLMTLTEQRRHGLEAHDINVS